LGQRIAHREAWLNPGGTMPQHGVCRPVVFGAGVSEITLSESLRAPSGRALDAAAD